MTLCITRSIFHAILHCLCKNWIASSSKHPDMSPVGNSASSSEVFAEEKWYHFLIRKSHQIMPLSAFFESLLLRFWCFPKESPKRSSQAIFFCTWNWSCVIFATSKFFFWVLTILFAFWSSLINFPINRNPLYPISPIATSLELKSSIFTYQFLVLISKLLFLWPKFESPNVMNVFE